MSDENRTDRTRTVYGYVTVEVIVDIPADATERDQRDAIQEAAAAGRIETAGKAQVDYLTGVDE